jgi:hypothetical protein
MFLIKKSENREFLNFLVFLKSHDFAGFSMENWGYLGAKFTNFDSKARFGKDINFFKMFNRSEPDLRTIKWSMEAPESTEGKKSSTWVKCSIRRNSYIKFLMFIYGFLGC